MDALLASGNVLNSRYQIVQELGRGGFGRTYLAEDINRFRERCVLKEFVPQLQGSFATSKAQKLFEREAEVLYRLQHPQIPKFRELFRYNQENEERLFLVQDYVEGKTYYDLFNDRGRTFGEAEIERLLRQLLPVLEYIHSMGVIHRDIAPDNIILRSTDGLPMLIDFGCIKEMATKAQSQPSESTVDRQSLSRIGTVIGKSGYAPPEQMERGIVCAHSDLYALAATAVVLLTGKKPQQLIDLDRYCWDWQKEVKLNLKLQSILTTMLALNPSDRFSSATEVMQALRDSSAVVSSRKQNESEPIRDRCGDRQISSKKSQTRPYLPIKLLFFLPLTATILLGNLWWLKGKNLAMIPQMGFKVDNATQVESRLPERFSQGEKVLISQTTTPEKELAAAASAKGKYEEAASLFSASLKILANDPEALIYLNNARIGREKSYSIAVSVPIGSDVNAAQEILRGVAQAQDEINQKGGFDGTLLKVQIINDDNDPTVAKQVATTLGQNPDILGVVGHYASDVTLATAKIYQSSQLVSISPISTSVKLSHLSPYLFRTVPSDRIAARALANYAIEDLDKKNVAVFYSSQSNYSKSLKSEFVTNVSLSGGHVVGEFDLSDANFSAADSFKQAKNNGAEVLMLAANTGTIDKALQVIQVNRQQLVLLGGDDVYTPKTLQVAGELAEGMVLAIPWHIENNSDAQFAQTARELWRGNVNWRTAMAYDAAKALIAAIDRSPTRIGVQKVLSDPNFFIVGARDRVRFSPSGDRLKQVELVKVRSRDRNSFRYEFTPVQVTNR